MSESMARQHGRGALVSLGLALTGSAALAQPATGAADQSAELAQKLSNPVAALISVPFKLNWDTGIGPAGADRSTYIVQPVIPIALSPDWNLISRTIVPYIDAQSPVAGGSDESGLGDTTQSFFKTATNDALGSEKWGAGPTAVLLRQDSGWTYGVLANHIWSFGGNDQRADISATFLQPFLSYTTKTATTWGVNTESTYDWKNSQWTVPLNVQVSQLMKLGAQPVSFALGLRSYLERPQGGPDWGLSFTVTLLFPK